MSQTQEESAIPSDDFYNVVATAEEEQLTDDELFENEKEDEKPEKRLPHRFKQKWPKTYEEATDDQKEQMCRKFITTNNKEKEKNRRKQAQNKLAKEKNRAEKKRLATLEKNRRELQKWKLRKGIKDEPENNSESSLKSLLVAALLSGKL
ncbi:MAG: hypothetical protein KGJ07_03960 [Patescibacteria group bacterium]|nr:hypothetical protein [Patescibacteria group bacterium]